MSNNNSKCGLSRFSLMVGTIHLLFSIQIVNSMECHEHLDCKSCAASYPHCHWCGFDDKCHAVGSIHGCAIGDSCADDDHDHDHDHDHDDDHKKEYDTCNAIPNCTECNAELECHWCAFDRQCHPYLSPYGCATGADCDKDDHGDYGNGTACHLQNSCTRCAGVRGCHWCAFDESCHAELSPYGCSYGVDCYADDRCMRKEPETLPIALGKPNRGVVILTMAVTFLSLVLHLACYLGGRRTSSPSTWMGPNGEQIPLNNNNNNNGNYGNDEYVLMRIQHRTVTTTTAQAAAAAAAAGSSRDHIENGQEDLPKLILPQNENEKEAPPATAPLIEKEGASLASESQCDTATCATDSDQITLLPESMDTKPYNGKIAVGGEDDTIAEEPTPAPTPALNTTTTTTTRTRAQIVTEPSSQLTQPLIQPTTTTTMLTTSDNNNNSMSQFTSTTTITRLASFSATPQSRKGCTFCFLLSLLITLIMPIFVILYVPRVPIADLCNDNLRWSSIIDGFTSFKAEASFESLVSVANPNRFGVTLQSFTGTVRHDSHHIGTFEVPAAPLWIHPRKITDLMATVTFVPESSAEALRLPTEYYKGTLQFLLDIQATILILGEYTYTLDFKDVLVHVRPDSDNDTTEPDEGTILCACQKNSDPGVAMTS